MRYICGCQADVQFLWRYPFFRSYDLLDDFAPVLPYPAVETFVLDPPLYKGARVWDFSFAAKILDGFFNEEILKAPGFASLDGWQDDNASLFCLGSSSERQYMTTLYSTPSKWKKALNRNSFSILTTLLFSV